jgi:hypothetical protein
MHSPDGLPPLSYIELDTIRALVCAAYPDCVLDWWQPTIPGGSAASAPLWRHVRFGRRVRVGIVYAAANGRHADGRPVFSWWLSAITASPTGGT